MAEIYRFDGIVVIMYPLGADHEPAHIHARYGEYEAKFDLKNGEKIFGLFPNKQAAKIKNFIQSHRKELLKMWVTGKIQKIRR